MLTYAAYLSYLAMQAVQTYYPPGTWLSVKPLLEREFRKQPWYEAEALTRIFDSMVEHTPTGETPGRHSACH
jgi:hypothetical protein